MKFVKKLVGVIVVLVAVLFVVSLFLPSEVHVERSLVFKTSAGCVFNQVNNLENWKNWSPWFGKDPAMKVTYGEIKSGVGASYSWESQKDDVGNGKMVITESIANKLVKTDLDFMENGMARGAFTFEELGDQVKVVWEMNTNMGNNPVAKFFGLLMDSMIGPDFEKGLKNLNQVCQ